MKSRFSTFDIICAVTELQKLIGMRVNNVYDIDNKTYLIRLHRSEEKQVLLLESGNRIHITNFEWPKNVAPSGFSMKLRKHLKNKRLESLTQLGTDRIIDLQFGSGEAAYHVILELYDRGNIILTDYELTILNVLRPHTEGDKVKFAVREKYPQNRARSSQVLDTNEISQIINNAKPGDQLKKIIMFNTEYGPALLEHVLVKQGYANSTKVGKDFDVEKEIDKIHSALIEAETIFEEAKQGQLKGYVIQKEEKRASMGTSDNIYLSNQEFHPMLFQQHSSKPFKEYETFNIAVDEFFSTLEDQKIELKAVQQEREALKKLENVKKDHDQRLVTLEKTQEVDKQKAEFITKNGELVDKAILAVRTALANQMSWTDIEELVKDAASKGDPVAQKICKLKLEINHISLVLSDPYAFDDSEDENIDTIPVLTVDIDLDLTAFANARKYYDQKRNAAKKQQKTIESQSKALKSAERKTKQTLKEVQTITSIHKARKVYWFEKFFWFISSENYLVIGGRDQQQNELIVKRYMNPKDIYVHADVHGASSIVIKNPTDEPVPPKTLNEAGTMAICYSVAWDAKVVTNAYWVWGDQVSKTAPTGEYLTTGSFMIRGKKNFLPPSHLILGLGFLFRLEDSCIERHLGERKVLSSIEESALNLAETQNSKDEVEVDILDEDDEDQLDSVTKEDSQKSPEIELNLENVGKSVENSTREDTNDEKNTPESVLDEDQTKVDGQNLQFPDTHIKIQRLGNVKNILTQSIMKKDEVDEEHVIYLGDDKPVVIKPNTKNTRSRLNSDSSQTQQKMSSSNEKKDERAKRGQKSKLKKIKEKYKDQDEEERKLRMDILQSSGAGKENNKKNKKGKDTQQTKTIRSNENKTQKPQLKENVGADDEVIVSANVDMINALTGIPSGEDELLFAVPVIAPYNTLSQYKFKVKLTPGTGKRGKAAKTAVAMFLKDRLITQREKDLLKAVKDEQLARNIPGKVKLSAPRLQALKK